MTKQNLELIGRPSDSVRQIETPDGSALLDIRGGQCLTMTRVGAMIWRQLNLHCSPEMIASSLIDKFHDVPPGRIRDDVARFIADLYRCGLLVSGRQSGGEARVPMFFTLLKPRRGATVDLRETRIRVPRFLIWKALFGLLLYDVFRLGKNFGRMHACISNWPVASRPTPPSTVHQVCRAINCASVLYPKRVLCLQRSTVTTSLLRNCGVSAQMAIGAQKVPFKAHAWTEVAGRPINERADVQRAYLVWERC
jgi:transglutaminase superfamily protein/coenzyme PQQ synthesis protein D (PqqD)